MSTAEYDWTELAQREHQEHAVACAEVRVKYYEALRKITNDAIYALPPYAIERAARRTRAQAQGDHVEAIVDAAMERFDEAITPEVAEHME